VQTRHPCRRQLSYALLRRTRGYLYYILYFINIVLPTTPQTFPKTTLSTMTPSWTNILAAPHLLVGCIFWRRNIYLLLIFFKHNQMRHFSMSSCTFNWHKRLSTGNWYWHFEFRIIFRLAGKLKYKRACTKLGLTPKNRIYHSD